MATKKVDITGLAAKSKSGWEKRTKELAKPEFFFITLGVDPRVRDGLTIPEYTRLVKKLELVREAATYMAAGMVKGTVKYASDDYSIEKWIANVVGEGSDLFNYQILMAAAFVKGKK